MAESRESQILNLLIKGMTSVQVSHSIRISLRTVEYHRRKLMIKYKTKTAFQLGYQVKKKEQSC